MKTTKWKYFNDALVIWNGELNDPQLEYKGKLFNYYVIEDIINERFNEFATENGLDINEENFETYCHEHVEDIKELFEIT